MVRPDLAARKVARADAWLRQAEELTTGDASAFARDIRRADLASFYILLATQEAVDLAAHWIADAGWRPADDVGGAFDVLAANRAITADLADEMRGIVRLRNRIAHGYASIDHARLHAEAPSGIETLRRFLAAVAAAAAKPDSFP